MNKIIATTGAVIALFLSLLIFRDIVAPVFQVVLFVLAVVAVLAGTLGFIFIAHLTIENMRTRTIKRRKSQFVSYQDGFGMTYLHDVVSGIIENLTVYPGSHRNGHWEDPNPVAAAGWHVVMGKRHSESPVAYLQAPEEKQQLDLLTIMTQPTQSYALIGGQQVGKTYQARRIASHWVGRGIKPLVIGPKWDRGEWDDCIKVGGEYDFEKVMGGLNAIKKLASQRHADTEHSHKEHTIQPVFFDDWTAIRAKLDKDAESFIVDATTLYASVNIILYFIIHLDTANAWGVGKIGAALKNNFVKLFIEPGFNSAGLIDRSLNSGYILMPGKSPKDRQQVQLFTEYGLQPMSRAIEPDLVIQPDQPTTSQQQLVIKLWNDSGRTNADLNKIADLVYGHGGAQRERTKNIIEKYCV